MKLIFYDFEVLKNDWLVSFYKEDTNQWYTFRNNRDGLCGFVLQHKSTYYFVGFNNKAFDDQCLKAIWYDINPYRVIEHSIIDNKPYWTLPEFQYKRNIPNFVSIDLMKFPGMQALSLKEIEGNLGLAIVENNLLNKDKLNDEEYKQVREQIECKEELINEIDCDSNKDFIKTIKFLDDGFKAIYVELHPEHKWVFDLDKHKKMIKEMQEENEREKKRRDRRDTSNNLMGS